MNKLLLILLSPSRAILEQKFSCSNSCKKDSEEYDDTKREIRGRILRNWSKSLFLFESALFCVLVLIGWVIGNLPLWAAFITAIYAYSRINEIAYAFLRDPLSKLTEDTPNSDLKPEERVVMAMRSYYGLTLNFSIWFFASQQIGCELFSENLFNKPISSFFDSFYYSVVTITTLGYGDIHPVHWFSKASVIYEVFLGLLLLIVAFAIYMAQIGSKRE